MIDPVVRADVHAANLRAAIATVADGLARLPRIDLDGDIMAQHQALRDATNTLAKRLGEGLDAHSRDGSGDGRISIFRCCGITATSTSGLQQAMKNWLTAANRHLEKLQ